jgi:hypothetical protein
MIQAPARTVTAHFYIAVDYRGITEKILKFITSLKSIYNKNFSFLHKNVFSEHLRKVKQ